MVMSIHIATLPSWSLAPLLNCVKAMHIYMGAESMMMFMIELASLISQRGCWELKLNGIWECSQVQVVVMSANMGCSHCRQRVTKVVTKMNGKDLN